MVQKRKNAVEKYKDKAQKQREKVLKNIQSFLISILMKFVLIFKLKLKALNYG